MPTWSVSNGSEPITVGFGLRTSAKLNAKGYAQVSGIAQTRRFMLHMARDYKTYNSWMKRGAEIVAAEGRRQAPAITHRMAPKIIGRASSRVTNKYGQKQTMIGGVVIVNTPYGKSVSFGRYYPSGEYTIQRSKRAPAFVGNRETAIRSGNPNKYLKVAREATKPNVVDLWNGLLRRYIEVNGFEYQTY